MSWSKTKKVFIILSIILCLPLIYIVDDFFRKDYEDPFKVGKRFSFGYMLEDKSHMKSWSDKKFHDKIDKLPYEAPVHYGEIEGHFWKSLDLVSSRKIGFTIVCTYALIEFDRLPLFYTVVLEPVAPSSYWERFKNFVYFKIPLGDKILNKLSKKDRWLVVDFFTNDDFEAYSDTLVKEIYEQDILKKIEQFGKAIKVLKIYEKDWSNKEKIDQNEEMRKLYTDYLNIWLEIKNNKLSDNLN